MIVHCYIPHPCHIVTLSLTLPLPAILFYLPSTVLATAKFGAEAFNPERNYRFKVNKPYPFPYLNSNVIITLTECNYRFDVNNMDKERVDKL